MKDAFDQWDWAEKPLDSPLMIDAEIHEAVMALPPDERRDGLISDLAGWRPAGSADLYGVPKATE